jgi:hypothetical protein
MGCRGQRQPAATPVGVVDRYRNQTAALERFQICGQSGAIILRASKADTSLMLAGLDQLRNINGEHWPLVRLGGRSAASKCRATPRAAC